MGCWYNLVDFDVVFDDGGDAVETGGWDKNSVDLAWPPCGHVDSGGYSDAVEAAVVGPSTERVVDGVAEAQPRPMSGAHDFVAAGRMRGYAGAQKLSSTDGVRMAQLYKRRTGWRGEVYGRSAVGETDVAAAVGELWDDGDGADLDRIHLFV